MAEMPSLQDQTIELGRTFKEFADSNPKATPSALSAQVFAEWLRIAGPTSRQPDRMADVLENYSVLENTNQDLFDLFTMLQSYIEIEDDFDDDEPTEHTFISLPLFADVPKTDPESF